MTRAPEPEVDLALAREHGLTRRGVAEHPRRSSGRAPSFPELGIFSVMWSEHCSYKSSKKYLKRLPTRAEHVLQGPGENAGVVAIGDGLAVVFKIESHNHPSFIEPYQGAATGVGGILRDIFTMGARPIASLDSLRFGPLDDPQAPLPPARRRRGHRRLRQLRRRRHRRRRDQLPRVLPRQHPGERLQPRRGARGRALPREAPPGVGNPVIYVGSKTGRDGIHGASLLASAEFDETQRGEAPDRAGGRSLHREVSDRGLPRG